MFRMRSSLITITGAAACLLAVTRGFGQFEIDWHTLDGGGATFSTGGSYQIGGTIGQPDAQAPPVMAGASFELMGGFWVVANVCYCPGDMNSDGVKNGLDVQKFIGCVISGGNCTCADVDAANGVNIDDVAVFVDDLLTGSGCP
jgi:hypothetical protein